MTAAYTAPNTLRQDCWPLIPDRLEDLGVPRSVIADLVLRYLWLHGSGDAGFVERDPQAVLSVIGNALPSIPQPAIVGSEGDDRQRLFVLPDGERADPGRRAQRDLPLRGSGTGSSRVARRRNRRRLARSLQELRWRPELAQYRPPRMRPEDRSLRWRSAVEKLHRGARTRWSVPPPTACSIFPASPSLATRR